MQTFIKTAIIRNMQALYTLDIIKISFNEDFAVPTQKALFEVSPKTCQYGTFVNQPRIYPNNLDQYRISLPDFLVS